MKTVELNRKVNIFLKEILQPLGFKKTKKYDNYRISMPYGFAEIGYTYTNYMPHHYKVRFHISVRIDIVETAFREIFSESEMSNPSYTMGMNLTYFGLENDHYKVHDDNSLQLAFMDFKKRMESVFSFLEQCKILEMAAEILSDEVLVGRNFHYIVHKKYHRMLLIQKLIGGADFNKCIEFIIAHPWYKNNPQLRNEFNMIINT
ncbi:hypothetical protein [Deinococcus misasensis]|uniref:hypothetical protein n=1 Tax=Deinococcus misasensis TaxID=392413 RepID=UPI0012FB1593|nr:hypothetical protein [Deinococcus misasensis]